MALWTLMKITGDLLSTVQYAQENYGQTLNLIKNRDMPSFLIIASKTKHKWSSFHMMHSFILNF